MDLRPLEELNSSLPIQEFFSTIKLGMNESKMGNVAPV